MNRLFKPLYFTIAFLICTGVGWGQTIDTLGRTTANAVFSPGVGVPAWNIYDSVLAKLVYTASAGDSVTTIAARSGRSGQRVQVGLYKFTTVPTDLVALDTITVTSGSVETKALSPKWALVGGQKYTYAVCHLDTVVSYRIGGDPTIGIRTNTTLTGLPATYSQNDYFGGTLTGYLLIGQYGVSEPTATLSVGPCAIGATKLAPSQ